VTVVLAEPSTSDEANGTETIRDMMGVASETYLPSALILKADDSGLPIFEGRAAIGGHSTAYVCRNFSCELPVTDHESLRKQLTGLAPSR
jgi:uncharacterized protein YyaL (SSP411 family)